MTWPVGILYTIAIFLLLIFTGNANSILHCTNQTDQVYLPHVVDLVRDSLLSLLQHLFNALQPDSAQVLFTTLSNAFPFPIAYSDGCLLSEELEIFLRNAIHGIPELQNLTKGMKVGVLPNLHCDPSLLRPVQQDGRFASANEAVQSILLEAVNAMFCIDKKHVEFLKKLMKLTTINSLLFQLKMLYLCVYNSNHGWYGSGHGYSPYTILNLDDNLQLDTPSGYKAFLYLADKWEYCLDPSDVLEFIARRFYTDLKTNGTTGRDEDLAHLISTVASANKCAVRSIYPLCLESLVRIVAQSNNMQPLFAFADAFDDRSRVADLEIVGRAFGRQYNELKARTEGPITDNTILSSLKTKCITILETLVIRVYEHHVSQYGNGLTSEAAREWALIVCAFGEDAVRKFLTFLQRAHRVYSLGKFPYSFCQNFGILWREYSTSLLSGNPSIFSVPAFERIVTHLLPEKEKNARNTIKKYRNNTRKVKEAMLLLASIYQPLQLEKEFKNFASKMFSCCCEYPRDMLVREFIRTPLSAIEIPTAMLQRLSELDNQGTARHHMDKQENSKYPHDIHKLPDAHMMQQYYAIGKGGQSKRMKI